jgi:hypothetical protein
VIEVVEGVEVKSRCLDHLVTLDDLDHLCLTRAKASHS